MTAKWRSHFHSYTVESDETKAGVHPVEFHWNHWTLKFFAQLIYWTQNITLENSNLTYSQSPLGCNVAALNLHGQSMQVLNADTRRPTGSKSQFNVQYLIPLVNSSFTSYLSMQHNKMAYISSIDRPYFSPFALHYQPTSTFSLQCTPCGQVVV